MKPVVQVFSFDLVSKLLLGVMGLALIRFMPEVEYARYTLALSISSTISQILTSSFNRIYIVGYQRLPFGGALSLLGVQLWIVAALAILMYPLAKSIEGSYWFAMILILATCLLDFSKTFYQRELKFTRFSIIELARSLAFVITLLPLIYFVRYSIRAWQVIALQAVVMIIVFSLFFNKHLDLRQLLKVSDTSRFARAVVKSDYKYLVGYFSILAVFSQIDVFILKIMTDDQTLATYGSAFRYYSLLSLALGAVHVVLLPLIQKLESATEFDHLMVKQRKLLVLFAPLVLIAAGVSKWVLPWIDHGKYPDAVAVFRILCISTLVSFTFSPYVNLVMRFEDFKFLLIVVGIGLLLSVSLNLMLIPVLKAVGTAITTLTTFGLINGLIFLRAKKHRNALVPLPEYNS